MNYLQNISEWEYSKLIDRMAQDDDVINARSLTYSMIIDQEFPSIWLTLFGFVQNIQETAESEMVQVWNKHKVKVEIIA